MHFFGNQFKVMVWSLTLLLILLLGYVDAIRDLVFEMPEETRKAIYDQYQRKVPSPMNTRFPERPSKVQAVENYNKRKHQDTALYPSGKIHTCIFSW